MTQRRNSPARCRGHVPLQVQRVEELLLIGGEGRMAGGRAMLVFAGPAGIDHQRLADGAEQVVHPRHTQVDSFLMQRPLQQCGQG